MTNWNDPQYDIRQKDLLHAGLVCVVMVVIALVLMVLA